MSQEPDRLGPYEIRETVGSGGMGVVYRGWDPKLDRAVAVKTLRPELASDPSARNLFLREARAIAAISHPNVTQIYYIGEEADQVFFAMEFLEGRSLQQILAERERVGPFEAIEMIRQAAQGLKAAADRGIVHRDIKPSNLVLGDDGVLKVTDFGLAKQTLFDPNTDVSTILIGTADYMSPERASGEGSDLRSDIYSLGATFFELVTGRPPFQGPTTVAVIMQHVRERAPEPRRFNPTVPYPLSSLILRMLAKRPEIRPQDYDALLKQLDRLPDETTVLLDAPVEPLREAPVGQVERPRSKRSAVWVTLGVGLAGLVALGAWSQATRDPVVSRDSAGTESTAENQTSPGPSKAPPPVTPATRNANLIATTPPQAGREAAADLAILDQHHEFTREGDLHVTGTVSNVGDRRAAGARIRIIAIDTNGQEVASTETPLAPNTIGPGELGNFDVVLQGASAGASIKLELFWLS